MQKLRQNNFNILLQGRPKGRGQGIKTAVGRLEEQFDNFKIICNSNTNERKFTLKEDEKNKKADSKQDKQIKSLNKIIPIQFEFEDADQCVVCDRPNGNLLCRSCGESWNVILFLFKSAIYRNGFVALFVLTVRRNQFLL